MGTPATAPTAPDRLAEALFGKTRRELLALFFARPHQSYYLRQIARETGAGIGSVQRELARLLDAGLLTRSMIGTQAHYAANRAVPVYNELRALLTKTIGVASVIRNALLRSPAKRSIKIAFIYGSLATGRQSASSDIDLMVIGNTATVDLLPELRKAQLKLGREINPTVYDAGELREKARSGGKFVARVLREPRIMVLGTDNDIEAVVGKPLGRRA
jgi:predicted nucleotidyltransferase